VLSSVDLTPDIGSPNWSSIFSDLMLPLHIDVGCAKGRCIEKLSYRYSPRVNCPFFVDSFVPTAPEMNGDCGIIWDWRLDLTL
jgi:hypothetical protein